MTERATKDKILNPFVLGAIIDLRHCLDLLDSTGLAKVAEAHALVKASYATLDKPLPANIGGNDKAIRILDCLVINSLHDYRKTEKLVEYDSVRAAFPEGEELYADAGFKSKNHIQLCIRDKRCIKGYFRPIAS